MRKYFVFYIVCFFVGFIYLANHSIVSLDEVMLLDPCINLIKGSYSSKLWYAVGTEDYFMAYLPATSFLRIPFLYLFPNSLFFHRLPFILIFIASAYLLFRIIRVKFQNSTLPVISVLFFLNDKGLWEATLSGRSEIIQVFLILLFFWIELQNHTVTSGIVKGIIVGCLFLTHPPVWVISFTLLLFLYRKKFLKVFFAASFSLLATLLLYLITIKFNVEQLTTQLFLNTDLASIEHSFYYRVSHFYLRFIPYPYLYQPWVIILLLLSLLYCLNVKIFKERYVQKICLVLLIYLAFLVFFSENYYRYNPPLLVCIYLLLPFILKYIKEKYSLKFNSTQALLLFVILSFPYIVRCTKVFIRQEFNDTELLKAQFNDLFIDSNYNKMLLIGEPVGYYFSLNSPSRSYSTFYTLNKFNLLQFDKVLYLTYSALPSPEYRLVKEFYPGEILDGTYKGLKIFEKVKFSFEVPDI